MRIVGIHYLRGIASVLVLLSHAFFFLNAKKSIILSSEVITMWRFGDIGVDIFFIISGYVILHSIKKNEKPLKFLAKRAIRIFPTYLIYSSILFLSFVVLGTDEVDYFFFLSSIAFLPTLIDNKIQAFLGPGWTLNFEVYFYLLISIGLILSQNKRQLAKLVVILIIVPVLIGIFYQTDKGFIKQIISPINISFILGLFLYFILSKTFSYKYYYLLITFMVSTILTWNYLSGNSVSQLGFDRLLKFTPIATTIFILGYHLNLENFKISKVINYLGNISFTLYLLHYSFGFQLYWKLIELTGFQELPLFCHLFSVIIFLVLISYPFYYVFEKYPSYHLRKLL